MQDGIIRDETGAQTLIGYVLDVGQGDGRARCHLEIGPQHLNRQNGLHGGIAMSVLHFERKTAAPAPPPVRQYAQLLPPPPAPPLPPAPPAGRWPHPAWPCGRQSCPCAAWRPDRPGCR